MSLSKKSLTCVLALALTLPALAAEARNLRDNHQLRQQQHLSRSLTRLLPTLPRPARNFLPVPVESQQQFAAVYLDRELVWIGEADRIAEAVEALSADLLEPPNRPPWDPRPLDARELCVGVALQADVDADPDGAVTLLDCEELDLR